MLHKIIRGCLTLAGAGIGIGGGLVITGLLERFAIEITPVYEMGILVLCGILFAIIFYFMSVPVIRWTIAFTHWIEGRLSEVPMSDIVLGAIGLIVGLFIAFLISDPIGRIRLPWLASIITVALYLFLGYLGLSIAIKRGDELGGFVLFKKGAREQRSHREEIGVQSKILDTSVIIDGRIFDICKTGFVEGPLIIPSFVLEELRHIADSSDALKRNRGRRGLDVLNRIQKELEIGVQIYEDAVPEAAEVDTKLLKLGQRLHAKVVTNDYNLNKVAEFQGVAVLNINELANAVKPVVLPGEEMVVQVIKDGKEMGQGVAYLDDGTMIVVDGGKKFVGETIGVLVTSVLQTAAGRMIFAKPKAADRIVS